ncbi:MAG: hypothetical protein H7841_09865 [Magnetospirillum sp. WYHS-4]
MKSYPLLALLAGLIATPAWATDPADPGERAVANAGRLNGIALACRAKDEADRLRLAVIEHAPKLREIGELFEKSTDASFKEAATRPCPLPEALRMESAAAVERLRKIFPPPG